MNQVSPEAVRMRDAFTVEWPSALTRQSIKVRVNKTAEPSQVLSAVHLEIAMALSTKAFELMRDARDVLGQVTINILMR